MMKASVKLREDQHPLVRAKVPVDLIKGLPLNAGISLGTSHEFAVHLGASLQAGLCCRLSYRPNNAENSFAVALKSNFGRWISSSTRATLSVAAEFNLSKSGCPSFRFWMKPRIGDYSLSRSLDFVKNGFSGRSYDNNIQGGLIELKEVSEGGRTLKYDLEHSVTSPVSLNNDCSASVSGPHQVVMANGVNARPFAGGEGQQSWGFRCAEDDTAFSGSNFVPESKWNGRGALMREQQRQSVTIDSCESPKRVSGLNFLSPAQDEGKQLGFLNGIKAFEHERDSGMQRNRFKRSSSGWSMRAHTSLPLGRLVMARIRWSVDLPSDLFENFESRPFSFLKLPMLSMDKVTVEGMGTLKKPRRPMHSQREPDRKHKFSHREMPEKSLELEEVAAMCSSMKQQLHVLHGENKALMKTMDDLKTELNHKEIWDCDAAARSVKDYFKQDDNLLYLRLFGEILAKCDNTSKGIFLDNVRRLGKPYKENFIEEDKTGAKFDSRSTSDNCLSQVPQELQKAIIKVNGGNISQN